MSSETSALAVRKQVLESELRRLEGPNIQGFLRFEQTALLIIKREVEQIECQIEVGVKRLKERLNMTRRRDTVTKDLGEWRNAESGSIPSAKMSGEQFEKAHKSLDDVAKRLNYLEFHQLPGGGNWRTALIREIKKLNTELLAFAQSTERIAHSRVPGNERSADISQSAGQEEIITPENPPPAYSAVETSVQGPSGSLQTPSAGRRQALGDVAFPARRGARRGA